MVGKHFLLTATTALFATLASAAIADTDRLPAERIAAMQVAFERVLAAPAMDVDRLSPGQLSAVAASYASHQPQTTVDTLPHLAWVHMQDAYRSHDPETTILASSSTF